jgi:DNA-binding NarL/FixJ family response regulator
VLTEDAYSLTRQQKRVLRLLSEGSSNKVIAAQLSISEATVKAHMSEIFKTLN